MLNTDPGGNNLTDKQRNRGKALKRRLDSYNTAAQKQATKNMPKTSDKPFFNPKAKMNSGQIDDRSHYTLGKELRKLANSTIDYLNRDPNSNVMYFPPGESPVFNMMKKQGKKNGKKR